MAKKPWEFQPDLQPGRLQLVAKVLRDAHKSALQDHSPNSGDTGWVLGCVIYGRSCEMLMRAGEAMWPEWFRVINPPLEFVFGIGRVPVRIYRGDPHEPGGKHLKLCAHEMVQLDMLDTGGHPDLIWRIAIEPDISGDVNRVVLVGTTESGDQHCFYEIPDAGVVAFLPSHKPTKGPGPGVTLPPPLVTPRVDQSKKDDDKG